MAIQKMRLVKISGPSSKIDKIINACCSLGSFQPENASEYISETMGYSAVSQESPYGKILQNIRDLAENNGFSLEEPTKTKKAVLESRSEEYIANIEEGLNALVAESKELSEQLSQCNSAIEKYSHFCGLNINLEEIFSCEFISARFGHLSKEGYIKLTKGYSENPYILFCPCSTDNSGYWGAYFAPAERVDEVDRIFASLHFERLHVPSAVGTADEIIDNLKENIEIITERKNELDKKIKEIWEKEGDKIKGLYHKLSALDKAFELRKFAVFHSNSCFFVGWIPASDEKKITQKLLKYPEFVVEFESPEKSSGIVPPTKLRNNILFRPFEYYVSMYGLPSYYDIDITAFVAITYTLLFGIMFGDLGQGLILSLVGFFMWKKKGSGLGRLLVPCGLCSAFFGLVFGSVFGFEEALDPLYHSIGMAHKPLEVMESINTVLLLAIGIGVALVIVAMGLNVVSSLKKKKFGSAIFSHNGIVGIITYIGGANLVYAFMAGEGIFSTKLSAVFVVSGLVLLFNQEIIAGSIDKGRLVKPESISDYIMQNFFECIEYVLSYFSNTVSFLRVGAFVIVHASMMMVVFTLAGDTSTPKGIIVVILGNILVIALEGLLTGIQGLRLEFYEMFSRFYEGDGKAFLPVESATEKK